MEIFAPTIPEDGRILFFKRDRGDFGFLSNFHDAPVLMDGELWRSTEFYYQTQKSHSSDYRDAIRQASGASHAKALGTDPRHSQKAMKRSWFKDRTELLRSDWNDVKLEIMRAAALAKFTQNLDLQAMLLATADAEIIEDSTHDPFWGIGTDGQGPNWMGRILMEVRSAFRETKSMARIDP